jgi:hypothetical protein
MPLLRGMARTAAIAGTATAVSNRVSRRQGERWAAQGQMEPEPVAEPAAAPAPAAAPDPVAQLERLGELRTKGLLTDEEFAAEKAKVLNA